MSDRPDLSAILAGIHGGDPNAMQSLYELYAPQLYRVSMFRLGEAESAQEVVQDVFVKVWHGLRTFEYRGESALVAWLHTITGNAVINHVRKLKRRPTVSLDTNEGSQLRVSDMARSVCERLELRQAITLLSPAQQRVVVLRYFAGLSNGETALVLGRSEGAIKALHHRALLRLHHVLTVETAPMEPMRLVLAPA